MPTVQKSITFCFLSALLLATFYSTVAAAAGQEELAKYQLRVDGWGPVQIGMTPEEASRRIGIPLTSPDEPDGEEGTCRYFHPNGEYKDIGFMVEDGLITRIDVYSNIVQTVDGVRVGDSERSVKKIFHKLVKERMHPYIGAEGKYLTVELIPGFAFVFETDNGKITTFRSGKLDATQYIEGCL